MKNKFFACFTGTLLAVTINNIAYTQSVTSIAKLKRQVSIEKIIPSSKKLYSADRSDIIFRNDIKIKAVRNFIRDFENVSDVIWRQSANGSAAYFTMNGIKTRVFYHKNGDYQSMIKYYYEDKLAPEIRHLVKSSFYDFSIYGITELNKNGQTIYEIKIEDKTSWKTIRIMNGEMEIKEEYNKA